MTHFIFVEFKKKMSKNQWKTTLFLSTNTVAIFGLP